MLIYKMLIEFPNRKRGTDMCSIRWQQFWQETACSAWNRRTLKRTEYLTESVLCGFKDRRREKLHPASFFNRPNCKGCKCHSEVTRRQTHLLFLLNNELPINNIFWPLNDRYRSHNDVKKRSVIFYEALMAKSADELKWCLSVQL